MADIIPVGKRISELADSAQLNDADVIPLSNLTSDGYQTGGAKLTTLRGLLNFDNAFLSVPDGLANTLNGQIFHVWRDGAMHYADEYLNVFGVAEPVLDNNGGQKSFPSIKAIEDAIRNAGYTPVDSFEKGARLDVVSQSLRFESTGAFFSWRGVYGAGGKVVPPGSTPETTGGFGSNAWVDLTDLTLRTQIASSSGYSLVGVKATTLDQILRVNVRQFNAHSITESGYENFDSASSIQSAIEFVRGLGGGEVFIPEGTWRCVAYTQEFTLPGDDGTASPAFIATGNDVNIAAEPVNVMHAALRGYNKVAIVGAGKDNTKIIGDWNINASPIGLSGGIGIYFGGVSKSSIINYVFRGVTLQNYFIGRCIDGISAASQEDDLYILNCGISGIMQGVERHMTGSIVIAGCYSGDVIGGHWLHRNNTQSNANIPPYPSADAYLLGWADYSPTFNYICSQHSVSWGERHNAIDEFFDTYFFKSGHSTKTSLGGRLTNTSDNTGAIPAYRGIAGRAKTVFSRYGRPINNLDIFNLKLLRQHRTAIFQSNSLGQSPIHQSYIEGVGLVNPNLPAVAGNLFGIDMSDPLNPAQAGIGYVVAEGGATLKSFTISSQCQHAPLSARLDANYAKTNNQLYVKNLSDSQEFDRNVVWDGTTTDIRYIRYSDNCFSQPIAFALGGEPFRYIGGQTWTPSVTVGGVDINSLLSLRRGGYKRVGRTIKSWVQLGTNGSISLPAGELIISGLPFIIADGSLTAYTGLVDFSLSPVGVNIRPKMTGSQGIIRLITDTRGTSFDCATATVGTLALYVTVDYVVAG